MNKQKETIPTNNQTLGAIIFVCIVLSLLALNSISIANNNTAEVQEQLTACEVRLEETENEYIRYYDAVQEYRGYVNEYILNT